MKGMQGKGCFPHFPGHGDTDTDSTKDCPPSTFLSKVRGNGVLSYKKMFEEGLASVMVAHLNVPSLESKPNYPSSISYNVVTNVLQKNWAFRVLFSDALNMKAVSKFSTPGQIDLRAFWRGTMFYYPEDVPLALDAFRKAYHDSLFTDSRLASSVKILKLNTAQV
jgi:beta-glucosidase-like glycosyl hydrolase